MTAQCPDARANGLSSLVLGGLLVLFSTASGRAQVLPGVDVSGAVTGDAVGVVSGGLERSWAGLYNVDLRVALDGPALGWSGGRVFLYVLGNGGEDPSERVGDVQGVNNIAAPETWKLFEAWVQQDLWNGSASIRAGLYDLNSEFDVLSSAASLLNSSFGIGPDFSQSCLTGPSIFPTTSLALRVEARPGGGLLLRGAVLDGVPGDPGDPSGTQIILDSEDGLLVAGEAEWARSGRRAAVGLWGYTRKFQTNRAHLGLPGSAGAEAPSFGGYALTEARLFTEPDRVQGLRAFARVGLASGRVNRIGTYLGAGGAYTGLLPGREHDELAVGVAAARNSGEYMAARRDAGRPSHRWEVALEATYVLRVADGLSLQPDLQVVLNPGAETSADDAVVLGFRMALER